MDHAERERLRSLAWKRLEATANDDERWSFLFRTEGAEAFSYCRWSLVEDWEFDGEMDGLDLPWTEERRAEIDAGDDLVSEELVQWRRARAIHLAKGSDWASPAHVVPLLGAEGEALAWALFTSDHEDADPMLEDVFSTFEEALAALHAHGAVAP